MVSNGLSPGVDRKTHIGGAQLVCPDMETPHGRIDLYILVAAVLGFVDLNAAARDSQQAKYNGRKKTAPHELRFSCKEYVSEEASVPKTGIQF
jgi:hypothetical protein